MLVNSPRPVEFRTIKKLITRLNASRESERNILISVYDMDVPSWQRQIVWTEEDKGLLAYSILRNYPIGMMVLWKKKSGIRVPIDGRQRLTAIRDFYEGSVPIPNLKFIPDELKNKKYKLLEGDEEKGYRQLDIEYRENYDDYETTIVEYENLDEKTAMDIFVKLQGGKPLNKTEIRAALGGKLCNFVTEMTSKLTLTSDDIEEIETPSKHPFFQKINIKNYRKAHRNLCDILLHEFVYPGQDKHWSSLETLYLDKSTTITDQEKRQFVKVLGQFQKAVEIEESGHKIILPQLKSVF
ncbi:MAG: DUF262 domain-containing protein [Deltaproteobacteria bacterium]|uniref:DUF262 domain-containing protein n=1 Tax=Candidatus Zymogenus saltonus TaxID=2844893 RepID=A0A9D8KDB7_9DELT|nr:DUF262 domain-containing protein [Candidatus Zymogenus saltonus]